MRKIVELSDGLFTDLGSFQVASEIAIGESFEHVIGDAAGTWQVRWIDIAAGDKLYDTFEAIGEDPEKLAYRQFQIYLEDVDPNQLIDSLEPLCVLPIDGAMFRVGDSSLKPFCETHGPLTPLFDGVHGLIGGAGASVYLGGSGRAEVHIVADEFGPQLIVANLP